MNDATKIYETLEKFDFYKVFVAMDCLGWTWVSSTATPTVTKMKEVSKRLLEDTADVSPEMPRMYRASGGFHAKCEWTPEGKVFWLGFVVTEMSSDYDYC